MIEFLVIFINGILAGLSGCIFLLFPLLLKYIHENKKNSKIGLLIFSLGLIVSQFFIFILFNFLSQVLTSYFIFFQSLLTIFAGALLFYIFYKSEFKNESLLKRSAKKRNNLFFYGLFFGLTLTSCSLGFLVGSVSLSISYNLINTILSGLLFSIGLILPILILSLFFDSLNEIVSKYQKHHLMIKKFSNYILLFLSYYFLYKGFSSLNINSFLSFNMFWLNLVIFLFILFYLIVSISQINKFNIGLFLKVISLLGLVILFIFHCFFRKESCVVCYINNSSCLIELTLFFLFSFIGIISKKVNQLLDNK
ncbi:MAG: cytochrome c biogenesis protein CcdA [archaeon]